MESLRKLLNTTKSVSFTQIRTLIRKPPLPEEGGIKYFGFTYYPRSPDFKDPPYDPTKLFLVRRIKRMKGLNPIERSIMEKLNIDGKPHKFQNIAVVKNIPEVNASLWKVKHLVKITPIRIVNGLPKDGDFKGTYLRDNGEFIVSRKVQVDPKVVEAHEKFHNDKNKFDGATMRKYLKQRWDCPYTGDV
ncbi:UNVERIFIED_CONTAM: hypothetical protein PYX00_001159 [Menopon gallinae]|uniref:39S ribosomal protein L30, mitochondrial n=1 Tax=Menopon gallinae TaxID=328185 RepID=A0AAW2ICZ9_9NEOP